MFLHLDKTRLHLQAVVGILEKYEPTEKIEDIQAKLTELKNKVEKFQAEVVFPILTEIEKEVNEENNKYIKSKEPPE